MTRRNRPLERVAYGMEEAAEALGIGRTNMMELIAAGEIPTRRLGRRRLILAADLAAFVEQLPEERCQARPAPECSGIVQRDADVQRSLQRVSYGVEEAAEALGIGKTYMQELIDAHAIPTFRFGRRRLISKRSLAEFVDQLPDDQLGGAA